MARAFQSGPGNTQGLNQRAIPRGLTTMRTPIGRTAGIGRALCLVASVMAFTSSFVSAQMNSWINPGSAAWEGASNWSLGIRPAANQTVSIANGGYKAVGISSSTVSGFPDSMTVSNLSVSAPANALSVLLLNYAGTSVPLHVLDVGSIGANGSIQNFYSSLQVDGSVGADRPNI